MTTVPIQKNYIIYQGALFEEPFEWFQSDGVTPINMTGWTARMQVRATIDATEKLIELTTENGGIIVSDAANGQFKLYIDAVATAALTPIKNAVYDLEIDPNDDSAIIRLLEGNITIKGEVTR